MLGGGAALIVLDVVLWFTGGYSFSHVIIAGAGLGVALILMRGRLMAGLSANYHALLVVIAIVVAFMGTRNLILDVLNVGGTTGLTGATMYLLGLVVVTAGSAAMAYGGYLVWRANR